MKQKTQELKERLIRFSVKIIEINEMLPKTKVSNYLGDQLLRSGLSPALNYAEAEFGESKPDFIHKLRICLKELSETNINLKIINQKGILKDKYSLTDVISECSELIAIFVKSVETSVNNLNKEKTEKYMR
jgi:four helix bundle protein